MLTRRKHVDRVCVEREHIEGVREGMLRGGSTAMGGNVLSRYTRSVGGKRVVTTTYLASIPLYGPEGPITSRVILSGPHEAEGVGWAERRGRGRGWGH